MYARGMDFDFVSMIFLLDIGTVLTVWYFENIFIRTFQ